MINNSFNTLTYISLFSSAGVGQKISKKHEMNIWQCIGEAVPTIIFHQIAKKIKQNSILFK